VTLALYMDHNVPRAITAGVRRRGIDVLRALNGHTGISPEMAVRLSVAFDTSAESWMRQQAQYDLWHAEQHRSALKVQKLSVA